MDSEFIRWDLDVSEEEPCLRILDGSAITNKQALLSEIASALNFPTYIGQNWDAFDECLRDTPEFNSPGSVSVVLSDAKTLRRRLPEDFERLLQVWAEVAPLSARSGLQLFLVLA